MFLRALVCDLNPRFIAKGTVGKGYRAIARNGRVLLATEAPLADLADRVVGVRLQTWHQAILPEDNPEPYGLLLCLRSGGRIIAGDTPVYHSRLGPRSETKIDLGIEVGGGWVLEFRIATTK